MKFDFDTVDKIVVIYASDVLYDTWRTLRLLVYEAESKSDLWLKAAAYLNISVESLRLRVHRLRELILEHMGM